MNFDPDAPPFPISSPGDYASDLASEIGHFFTTGMVEDHSGLSNGRIGEEAFLHQCDLAWEDREAMFRRELSRFDSGFLFCLFDTPDRVQHMLWRHTEPDHPANRHSPARPEMARELEKQYERADSVVGEALAAADDRTLVIAMSDHGFGGFRRCVDLNKWLHDEGLLALRDGLRPGDGAGDLLRGVDWSKTKAFAVGLGGIYLNLEGREAQGIVKEAEAEDLKARIAEKLSGLDDPGRGEAVKSVRTRESLYRGPHVADSPDLLVGFARGYRASWASSMGGISADLIEDNVKPWAGDHIVDPSLVPGILFMNRPFRGEGARLVDLAPTISTALGVAPGPLMEGEALLA